MQRLEAVGTEVVMLIIGSAFLVGYFYQKAYGLLIPAGILLGLYLGEVLRGNFWWANEGTLLGLGIGFLSIYVIARIYQGQSHWWPLIPGIILVLIGVPKSARIFRFLIDNWPLILVAIGLLVLVGAFRRPAPEPPPDSQTDPREQADPGEPIAPAEPEEPVAPTIE
ncbi:MAG: hypothetical protein ACE5EG_06600 [Thermoanaerobaculia bacterium]